MLLTLTWLSEGAIRYNLLTMAGNPISGSLWTLWLYDVCEEIDLDALRAILGVQAPREPRVRRRDPRCGRLHRVVR